MLHGHGGNIYALAEELGISLSSLSDFSSNVSPLPLPDGLIEHVCSEIRQVAMLPEVDSLALRRSLALRYGMRPDNFIVGSGTTEWIYRLARVIPASQIIIPLPSYSDYMDAAMLACRKVVETGPWVGSADAGTGRQILEALCQRADRPSLIYLCNPNNPSGWFIKPSVIERAINSVSDTIWVIDESYAPFVADDPASSIISKKMPVNCLVLRSFSKIYRIPGLRLGYLAGREQALAPLVRHLLPWAAGRLAQVAGEFLVEKRDYEEQVRSFWREEKRLFLEAVREIPWLEYLPGDVHFMLFKVKKPVDIKSMISYLACKGMIVRDCGNFRGLGRDIIRISLCSSEENRRLAKTLMGYVGHRLAGKHK